MNGTSFFRTLGNASTWSRDDGIIVSTGDMQRHWRLTSQGLATVSLRAGDVEWVDPRINHACDWRVPGAEIGELVSLTCEEGDDSGFTSRHLRIVSEFHYPIGDEPSNASWTGFQCRVDDRHGYLLVFRELENGQPRCRMPLRFSANACLRLQDLCSGATWEVSADGRGSVEFAIDEAPGFRFVRYERTCKTTSQQTRRSPCPNNRTS